ncbi:septal ring lytic transglycosylase RlpA family protein [Elizabethkingia meningoseptica]|uniref:Probable endolytic peptidoglycan transglycosylase RlpA n=3 Tax=Weeksellaceae TaxID=2762318 RepID=A0A1V3U6P7_ELIME|nr:septal ring lytic transglycosylase RlpA family protein [Elizabethkingia meningoseptica]EOR30097.1 Rare lipoprotein A [Elizabethkingia meningoseptica ATCC 13253 = NBRC 12535]AQX03780.1 hypothetical protein BBD33_00300 [Elizabethkingia meningoseptica]AQX11239.1 hypothetical protein BBD35_02095 [Elizabethkingia meningoseptica]AQX45819.1 hypothetical protein B5G46_00300 [Elizabethkingia meningoseptica]EJK5329868.1 septal ring lytic transglycosylase RlpA family protein [Elizabethkingia meningose
MKLIKTMSRIIFLLAVMSTLACSSVNKINSNEEKLTMVSYYGDKFNGRKTSSGEVFDNDKLTAAHANLPFGTKVLLTNTDTGDTVTVKVNDRGYLHKGRAFDITKSAFKKLGDIRKGVLKVSYKIVE